ncbi:hypothetical protein [Bacillus thuringiensis]|uniref:hypothetical protein n=1 Tax=Bacillus thuringiensis TaxID=1428 RepID=UPI001145F969|nr:hypothetical protein [Bacillus thuringiensis]
MHRSINDVLVLLNYPGRIRIVKGAYEGSSEIAIVRSKELTERYLSFVNTLVAAKHPVSIARMMDYSFKKYYVVNMLNTLM